MVAFATRVLMNPASVEQRPYLSIGVIAWNEEKAIGPMLQSLFSQSLFSTLARRNLSCEVVCVANGCSDRTAAFAGEAFERQIRDHSSKYSFCCRVIELPERGKLNAWNRFVHEISSRSAQFLFLTDADIHFHQRDTLANMLDALETDREANISVDQPRKDISFKSRPQLRERLSLRASEITASSSAQLCAQLYCIRSEIARNIYLPKDLPACEDGFIKQVVCTDFLTREVVASRIRLAEAAEHTFEAYTSVLAIFRNQKRQIIGQTIVHMLVDDYLKELPLAQRAHLAETLKELDLTDPAWLKRLIGEHLRKTRFFWRLYPGLLTHRFKILAQLRLRNRLHCLPTALGGTLVSLIACWMAFRTLKTGSTDYWPRAERQGLGSLVTIHQRT